MRKMTIYLRILTYQVNAYNGNHFKLHELNTIFFSLHLIELLIEGLGRASPIDDAEACIYGYGAVRFLANAVVSPMVTSGSRNSNSSSNAALLLAPPTVATAAKKHKPLACRLIQSGANPLMILHLQMINEAVKFAIS